MSTTDLDATKSPVGVGAVDGALETILEQLPQDVVDSFTPAQRAALWQAAKPVSWKRFPINLRLSFPFVGGRYFLTIVGGPERRSAERVRRERLMHPLHTVGNLLFLLGVGGAVYLAGVLGFFLFTHLIEF